jgi:hypothetical protein
MRTLFVAAILLLAAGQVHADAVRDALADVVKCADIQDPAKRLVCFDAAAEKAKGAIAAPAPAAAKEKSFLEWFGFRPSAPVVKPEDFGRPVPEPAPNEVNEVTSNVLEFAKTARGKAVFILENGQVWRQLNADSTDVLAPPPGTTMTVTIEVGALGSYNLLIAGRNGIVKVSRLK